MGDTLTIKANCKESEEVTFSVYFSGVKQYDAVTEELTLTIPDQPYQVKVTCCEIQV